MNLPADDRGLLLGDGLFETLLAEAGELRHFDLHLRRLERGCAVMGLPAPDRMAAQAAADDALAASHPADDRAPFQIPRSRSA